MVDLKEELMELIIEAKPKCKGHYDQIPKGVINVFIKSIEDRWNERKEEINLELLLYNQKTEIQDLIKRFEKILDKIEKIKEIQSPQTKTEEPLLSEKTSSGGSKLSETADNHKAGGAENTPSPKNSTKMDSGSGDNPEEYPDESYMIFLENPEKKSSGDLCKNCGKLKSEHYLESFSNGRWGKRENYYCFTIEEGKNNGKMMQDFEPAGGKSA